MKERVLYQTLLTNGQIVDRLKYGCVMLYMQEYAIRIPMWMAHKTDEVLRVFEETGRMAQMQKALECTWRLHWWRREEGRAFEVVM